MTPNTMIGIVLNLSDPLFSESAFLKKGECVILCELFDTQNIPTFR